MSSDPIAGGRVANQRNNAAQASLSPNQLTSRRAWSLALIPLSMLVLVLVMAMRPPAPRHYTIGVRGDERVVTGFWLHEGNEDETYRWTDGDSLVRIFGYEPASSLVAAFRLTAPQGPTSDPVTVAFTPAGQPPLIAVVQSRWRVYHLFEPHHVTGWSSPAVALLSDTFQPDQGDQRQLGVALSDLWVEPLPGLRPAALLERAGFLVLLLWLFFSLLKRLIGRSVALLLASVVAVCLVAALTVAPFEVAYRLPQLWSTAALGLAIVYTPPLLARARGRIGMIPARGLAGIVLAMAGAALLSRRLIIPGGFVLLALGGLVAGAILPEGSRSMSRRVVVVGLMGATVVAAGARFYRLDWLPFGLWRDEARFGILALQILEDPAFRPVYVPGGVDYPALLFYLTAVVIKVLGVQIASVRVVAALAGSLTPIPLFLLGRRLVGARAALLAALLLPVAAWHISLSRISFVAVLDPLFTMAGLAAMWSALESVDQRRSGRAWVLFVVSGLALGLALYTYHTARLMPILAGLVTLTILGRSWSRWQRAIPGLLLTAVIVGVIALPLLNYALTQQQGFNLRLRQTSVIGAAENAGVSLTAALDQNLRRYLLMWHWYGEPNGRHYPPGRPMLDPVMGTAFLVGLLITARRLATPTDRFLLAWFALEFIPALLSEGAPHAVRSVGTIAPALLLAGRGLAAVWEALGERRGTLAAGALVVGAAVLNLALYFGSVPYNPAVWSKFYGPETMIGDYLRHNSGPMPYIPRRLVREDVTVYLTHGLDVPTFDPGEASPSFPKGARLLLPADAPAEERAWVEKVAGSDGRPMRPYPGSNQPTFWLYQVP